MRPSMDLLAQAFADREQANLPAWLVDDQAHAWQRAFEHGLPWRRDEHWKYTSLFGLAKLPLRSPVARDAALERSVEHRVFDATNSHLIEWRNGRLITPAPLPEGVTLSVNGERHPADTPIRYSVMQDLNQAFADSAGVLSIADNTRLDKPIYLVHSLDGTHTLASPKLHIQVGAQCDLHVVDHLGGHSESGVTNRHLSLSLDANSHVQHALLQQHDHSASFINNTQVTVGRDAHYAALTIDLGAQLARHDLGIALNDHNAQCTMLAVYLPHGDQHVDHHTVVHHNTPHTHSQQRYHGVAGTKGHGVFNGKVLVQKDAQKITAEQSNQNILLSEKAAVDTKPELEIYADDVKCSHGATVGQLDPTSLFYLQSRGLSKHDAQRLLVQGFVRDIYSNVHNDTLAAWLDAAILSKLDVMVEDTQ
ncbi:MAG: Fe-S cluster assembly protein SufD [Pseudomonadota bacterium]